MAKSNFFVRHHGRHRQALPVAEGQEVLIQVLLSKHQPFTQVRRYQTSWSIPPFVAAQPRQQVAWATRHRRFRRPVCM
jgi:hypothetical protein